MSTVSELIRGYSLEVQDQVIEWRRDFHRHPEPGNYEFRTAKTVAEILRKLGVDEVLEGQCGGTGVLGVIHGDGEGPTVALRADMDALLMQENTGLDFASTDTCSYCGSDMPVMHACGHDAHMAMLLGAAAVLVRLKAHLSGKVLLVFQPAEEGPPPGFEGSYGAKKYLEEELFRSMAPKAIFGLHVDPKAPIGSAGQIAYVAGPNSMSCDVFTIRFHGRSAHGSKPWLAADTLIPAAQALLGIQAITTQNVNPDVNPVVLTCGQMSGGTRFSTIAAESFIAGNCRYTDYSQRELLKSRIEEVAKGCASAARVTAEVQWGLHLPCTNNNPELVEYVTPHLKAVLGEDGICMDKSRAFNFPDDVGYYALEIPCLYGALSVAPDQGEAEEVPALHTDTLNINEAALVRGVMAHSAFALSAGLF